MESKTGDESSTADPQSLMDRKREKADEARKQLDALFGDDKSK